MISLGRHLGSLLLGLASGTLLLSGLAVALPVGGAPADLATALGSAVRGASVVEPGPRTVDPDTVAAPVTRLRTVPRAVVEAVPVVTTPPLASPPPTAESAATPATAAPATAAAPRTVHRVAKDSADSDPAATSNLKSAPKTASGSSTKPAAKGPAAAVVAATNAERAEAGCAPLKVDSTLTAAAQAHAADMAAKDYFSHTDQDGGASSDRIHDAGFTGSTTGENIAAGQDSAAEVLADWMASSGHRHNILDCDYDRIGVGYDSRGDYWVQDFGG